MKQILAPLYFMTTKIVYKNLISFPEGKQLKETSFFSLCYRIFLFSLTDFLGSDSVFSYKQLNKAGIWFWLLAGSPSPPSPAVQV